MFCCCCWWYRVFSLPHSHEPSTREAPLLRVCRHTAVCCGASCEAASTVLLHVSFGRPRVSFCHPVSTYLGPWLLMEHRQCTTSLQRLLSWAILSSCFQLSPVCVMSASRSRRQMFFDLPLFRLPRGFHVSLSRNVGVWLSQCVAKPYPSSLKNLCLFELGWFSSRGPCC